MNKATVAWVCSDLNASTCTVRSTCTYNWKPTFIRVRDIYENITRHEQVVVEWL